MEYNEIMQELIGELKRIHYFYGEDSESQIKEDFDMEAWFKHIKNKVHNGHILTIRTEWREETEEWVVLCNNDVIVDDLDGESVEVIKRACERYLTLISNDNTFGENDKERAFNITAKVLNLDIEEVQTNGTFFESLTQVFDWIYIQEADHKEDLLDLVHTLSEVNRINMKEIGADTVAEYMVLDHENVINTAFGVVYLPL